MKFKIDIDVKDIIHKAAIVFEVNLEDITGKCRRRKIVDARRAIFYLLKTHYGISEFYQTVLMGKFRDHSTIIYLNETTAYLLESDYDFSFKYKRFFEYVTKFEYLKPLPPEYKKWTKEKIVYDYYTDDMIARSKLQLNDKMRRLSKDYKLRVKDFMKSKISVNRTMKEFNISRNLIVKILAERL